METFYINQSVGKKKVPRVDKIEVFVSLLGFGAENAIKREALVQKCIGAGIVNKNCKDADRAMRIILQRARAEHGILNEGKGYFKPTFKDYKSLSDSNKREGGRAIKVFASTKVTKALEDDYRHGRIGGNEDEE